MALTASIPVRLSAAASLPVSVEWTTRADTALAGRDFTAASGTLTFPPGETVLNITVTIPDGASAGVFHVDLSQAVNGHIADAASDITLEPS